MPKPNKNTKTSTISKPLLIKSQCYFKLINYLMYYYYGTVTIMFGKFYIYAYIHLTVNKCIIPFNIKSDMHLVPL